MPNNTPLRLWHYLAAILMPALLLVPLLAIILTEISEDIVFTQKEIQGIQQIDHLNTLVHTLQTLRGLQQIALQNGDATGQTILQEHHQSLTDAFTQLKHTVQEDPFGILAPLRKIQEAIHTNASPQDATPSPQAAFETQTARINKLAEIRRRVAVRSNLILDPVMESYFLMKLVVTTLPDLEESIGRVRGLGSGFLTQATLSDIDRLRFEARMGTLQSHLETTRHTQNIILESWPQSKTLFACFSERMNPAVQRFVLRSQALVSETRGVVRASDYFALGTQAIQTTTACSERFRTELIQRFQARLEHTKNKRLYVIVGAILALILATFFVALFYRRNQNAFEKMQASEHKNQAIVESAVDGILTIDQRGIIHSANAATEDIFGYKPGELLGCNVNILMSSPNRERHDGYLNAYLTTGLKKIIGYTREVEGVCKDGGVFPLELAVGEFYAGGERFFTGILHDITERKKANDALENAYSELERRVLERTQELGKANQQLVKGLEAQQRAERGLRLAAKVFEHASEAIVITDVTGNIVDVNQAYTTITGFHKEEVLGKNPRISKSGRHDQAFYQQMWAAILDKGAWSGEIWDRKKSGAVYPKWLTINAVTDETGNTTHFVGIFSDISHVKLTEERLEQLAFYDPLTQLPNRMLFKDRVQHEIDRAQRQKKCGAVFFIDLDRFKHVNDTLGHAAGDKLLVEISHRITACVRTSDTVARLGGDEFTVILVNLDHGRDSESVARKIIESVSEPVDLDGHPANIGASIGIAIFPDDGDTYDTITKYADVAMYHAKESGRGTYQFFEAAMNENSARRAKMEEDLHSGLKNKEFLLHYQPKVDVHSGRILGMEALVRWKRPDGTLVSPLDFIPLAEETGLIVPLGQEILRTACQYNKVLIDSGLPPIRVAVNLSGRQFQEKDLYLSVKSILEETGLSPELLDLEVTESMMMKDENQAIATLKSLRDIGLTISMDDFGTGYSSLSYLKRFPLTALKIDRSFVRDLTSDSNDAAIVSAIVSMAKSLGLRVVAEGVENQGQWDFLKDIECHELQGYYISKPLENMMFTDFLKKKTASG